MIMKTRQAETQEHLRAEERERARRLLRQLLDDMAERNADVPLEEVKAIVAEALAAVSAERHRTSEQSVKSAKSVVD